MQNKVSGSITNEKALENQRCNNLSQQRSKTTACVKKSTHVVDWIPIANEGATFHVGGLASPRRKLRTTVNVYLKLKVSDKVSFCTGDVFQCEEKLFAVLGFTSDLEKEPSVHFWFTTSP
jgi:hypothetical protein